MTAQRKPKAEPFETGPCQPQGKEDGRGERGETDGETSQSHTLQLVRQGKAHKTKEEENVKM